VLNSVDLIYAKAEKLRHKSKILGSAKPLATAEQRYKKFLAVCPFLLQRISLGHIASFLGITQETLSRIRAAK
jgi:hypothetical protein